VIKKYWLVIRFIISFVLIYSVLTLGYKFYLDHSDGSRYYPDYMTNLVGQQSIEILESWGYRCEMIPHPNEASLKVIINGKYSARLVEGCNAVSVLILFVSFILAFYDGLKRTSLFLLASGTIIYAANLLRLNLFFIGLYHYPWHQELMHDILFPLAIYGLVFGIWMLWIYMYSKNHKAREALL